MFQRFYLIPFVSCTFCIKTLPLQRERKSFILKSLGARRFFMITPGAFEPRSQTNNIIMKIYIIKKASVEWQNRGNSKSEFGEYISLIAAILSIIASLLTIICH